MVHVCNNVPNFRLYYEDELSGNTQTNIDNGFDGITSLGMLRQNTLCEVLGYIANTISIPSNITLDIYVARFYSPSNLAPPGLVQNLASASPYYSLTFNQPNGTGVYNGYLAEHILSGVDPDPNWYDAVLEVNFCNNIVNGVGISLFWDYIDYSNPSNPVSSINYNNPMRYDLRTILLHMMTHNLGWISNIQQSEASDYPDCLSQTLPGPSALNNSFTLFDINSLFYNNSATPYPGSSMIPLVQFDQLNPNQVQINPALSNIQTLAFNDNIWLTNSSKPKNSPVYASRFATGNYSKYNDPPKSSLFFSHLNYSRFAFQTMAQYSPGYLQHYLMTPTFYTNEVILEWTPEEKRHLNAALFYQFNTLQDNALIQNSPPFTENFSCQSKPAITIDPPHLLSQCPVVNTYVSPVDELFPEEIIPVNNASPLVNYNKPNATGLSTYDVTLAAMGYIDNENDPMEIIPGSIFGIRGVSDGGNNHNQLTLNATKDAITYTPLPGFHGLAQFGFRVKDNKETGGLVVVTIKVTLPAISDPSAYKLNPGDELVFNGNYEDGTEVKQRFTGINKPYSSLSNEQIPGEFFLGAHFSGGHPYSYLTNKHFGIGDVVLNGTSKAINDGTGLVPYPAFGMQYNSYADWITNNINSAPTSLQNAQIGQRYHPIRGNNSYSTLINPVECGNFYQFEFDFCRPTGIAPGTTGFDFWLDFVEEPINISSPVNYQSIPIHIDLVTANTWVHVVTGIFGYSGNQTYTIRLRDVNNDFSWNTISTPSMWWRKFIDNVSLKEVIPTFTLQSVPSPICQAGQFNLLVTSNVNMNGLNFEWSEFINGSIVPNLYYTSTPQLQVNISNLTSYKYVVHITGNCVDQYLELEFSVNQLDAQISFTDESCLGTQNGSISISNLTGGIAPITINYYRVDNGVNIPLTQFQNQMSVSSLVAGQYLVEILSSDGCSIQELYNMTAINPANWPYHPEGSGREEITAMCLDQDGNILVAGFFSVDITFPPLSQQFSLYKKDVFIAKIDPCGKAIWFKDFPSYGGYVTDIVTDANNEIYICGHYSREIDFDAIVLGNSSQYKDGFTAKLDRYGSPIWVKAVTGSGEELVNGICLDDNGNVYVVGSFNSPTAYCPGTLMNAWPNNTFDIMIIKYDNSGNYLTSQTESSSGNNDYGNDIKYCATCPANYQILITGQKDYSPNPGAYITIYSTLLTAYLISSSLFDGEGRALAFAMENSNNMIVVSGNKSNGNINTEKHRLQNGLLFLIWFMESGPNTSQSYFDYSSSVEIFNNNVYNSGTIDDFTTYFPIGSNQSIQNARNYVSSQTFSGLNSSINWVISPVGQNEAPSKAMCIDDLGNIYYAGGFFSSLTFGLTTFNSTSSEDAYIARIVVDPTGIPEYKNTPLIPQNASNNHNIALHISPNPATDMISVKMTGFDNNTAINYQITDLMGRTLIKNENIHLPSGTFMVNTADLSGGMYLLDVYTNTIRLRAKFVKR